MKRKLLNQVFSYLHKPVLWIIYLKSNLNLTACISEVLSMHTNEMDFFFSFPIQSGFDQLEDTGQHPGLALTGRQHLHHLFCRGSLTEAGAAESRANSVGKE